MKTIPQKYQILSWLKPQTDSYPEKDLFDMKFALRIRPWIELCAKYFRPVYHGLENVPKQGPALLVGNHGIIGFDALFILHEIYKQTGRIPRGLGEYHLFLDPISRRFWGKLGGMVGTQANATRFLKAGHLVAVYPGGARDAWKGREGRYRLHWEKSFGFIRLAMKTNTPIILHMGIGTDDTYRILGKIRSIARILGHPKYEIPVWLGWGILPRPVKFIYYISEPIRVEGGPDDIDDMDLVKKNHQIVWDLGHAMLKEGLAKRQSIWFG